MSLFLSLLPLYIFGNLHCAGMCGPLVMLLAKHRYRWYYFLGRLCSFSLIGLLSAEMGSLVTLSFHYFHLASLFSLLIGSAIIGVGITLLLRISLPGQTWLAKRTAGISGRLAILMARDHLLPTFLFGFLTILLPCGQTIVVFAACALSGSPLSGLFNGFAFALLTSPSLIAAMHATTFFSKLKQAYPLLVGLATITIGLLACLRGLADFDLLHHFVLNPDAPEKYHIVLF